MFQKVLALLILLLNHVTICAAQEIISCELFPGNCVIGDNLRPETVFITSEDEYRSLGFRDRFFGDRCDTIPAIDFIEKALIGHRYRGSSCDKEYRLQIEKHDNVYRMKFAVSNGHG